VGGAEVGGLLVGVAVGLNAGSKVFWVGKEPGLG
jgi:hypothetical protein